MKKILIPTDFSENAMNAIRFALEFLKYDITEFYLLHAYQDEVYDEFELLGKEPFENALKTVSQRSQLKLELLLENVKTIAPHKRYKFHVISAYNSLMDEVDKLVIGKNVDAIIMGTKGETSRKSFAFGSNTLQVLKYVKCPVLAIPQFYGYKQPKKVLFPTNYLIPFRRRELKLLSSLLVPYRSVIDMLYISNSSHLSRRQKDNKSFVIDEFPKNQLNFKTIESNNSLEAINTYITKNNMDLLIMVNTRHSFLEDMLFRSKVDDLCLHTKIPFLALQNIRRIA